MDMKLDNKKLKALRASRAWSQSFLAQASGVSLRTIQRIEKTGVVSQESLKCLCAALEIGIDDLRVKDAVPIEKEPSLSVLMHFKFTQMDKKMTSIAFGLAFVIGFFLSA